MGGIGPLGSFRYPATARGDCGSLRVLFETSRLQVPHGSPREGLYHPRTARDFGFGSRGAFTTLGGKSHPFLAYFAYVPRSAPRTGTSVPVGNVGKEDAERGRAGDRCGGSRAILS